MRVTALGLEDFRNYERIEVELARGLNLIHGRNAQGKTNLLEAIHCLSGLGSPRAADSALVRDDTERALIHAKAERAGRAMRLDMEIRTGKGTRALLNRTPIPKGKILAVGVVTVFFGPDELSLVKGSPEGRRRFLDELAVKLHPARETLRREWDRVLRQRNALLKSAPRDRSSSVLETLDVWDEAMARAGAALTAARLDALGRLLPYARKRFEEIAGSGAFDLGYSSSWVDEAACSTVLAAAGDAAENTLYEHLAASVASHRRAELDRGMSLVGPQRDDVMVRLTSDGRGVLMDARTYASQGDQRTAALALKLAEHDLLSEALKEDPILLLDDVFSELDPHRRAWLSEAVGDLSQTLVTSAEATAADIAIAEKVIEVADGKVRER